MIAIEDDGYATLSIKPAPDAPPVDVHLDLYEAQNAYAAITRHDQSLEAEVVYAAWREWLTGKGFPPMSVRAAIKVLDAINAAIDALPAAGGKTDVAKPTA